MYRLLCCTIHKQRHPIYRSEHVHDCLDPKWEAICISLDSFFTRLSCDGIDGIDDLPVCFKVYDYESNGNHVLIGSTETTIEKILENEAEMELTENEQERGTIHILSAAVTVGE